MAYDRDQVPLEAFSSPEMFMYYRHKRLREEEIERENQKEKVMSNIFHCAVCGGDLSTTLPFYTDILGCKLDNSEEGLWADVNFWGNVLTLHQSVTRTQCEYHNVEMGAVPVPHFGVHLEREEFDRVKQAIIDAKHPFVKKPFTRFAGLEYEQETFFVADPAGNILEIKSLVNPGQGLS